MDQINIHVNIGRTRESYNVILTKVKCKLGVKGKELNKGERILAD